jgi:UDP:flavonoid glycosyltransferase YjiC (YdhE family)
MARILCAWEFGGGLGHIRRLLPIALELKALGHDVKVAIRDSAHLEESRAKGFDTFIAPLLRTPREVNPAPLNFSDVLLNLGFDDALGLDGALRAWRSLFALLDPDVVVADYAPTAQMAARMASLPCATVGSGFALPVPGDPVPALRSWAGDDPRVLRARDDRLAMRVREAAGGAWPARAQDLFAADLHLLCTFADIDPFGSRENVEYLGPVGDEESTVDVRWQGQGPRIFAYLKPGTPPFDATLAGLAALGAETVVAAPGLAPEHARDLSKASMRVATQPVNVALLLPEASLCVSHAGPGLAAHALAAGVPLALLPLQLEQFLVSLRVEALGAGAFVSPEGPTPDLREWFAGLLASVPLREAAARQRDTYRGHSFAQAPRRAAQRIASLVRD